MSAAEWMRVVVEHQHCGGCSAPLPVGTPARRTRAGRVRCAACAKRLFDEDVPATLQTRTPTDYAPTFTRLMPSIAPLVPLRRRPKGLNR